MPPEPSLSVRRAERARAGRALKRRPGDPALQEEVERQRREYAAAKLADYIERVVASAPRLSSEQRDRLALLLRGGI